jgi:hypothetical protein
MATLDMSGDAGKLILGFHHLPHGPKGIAGIGGAHGAKCLAQRVKRALAGAFEFQAGLPFGGLLG